MVQGHFYFINDQYFIKFPDDKLMKNKEMVNGEPHDRPSFFAFEDAKTGLYWMIPFSSRVEKYRKHYDSKVQKYGRCDTIVFGEVMGHEKAFLIQNMCPVTSQYIKDEYINSKTSTPVRVNMKTERELLTKAKRILILERKGKRVIFPDVAQIEAALLLEKYE